MLCNEGDLLRRVVVCPPREAYFQVEDLAAHNIAQLAVREVAIAQHQRLCRALAAHGAEVISVPELARHPNSIFTQDPLFCAPAGFVRLRMGLPSRRGEEAWLAAVLEELNIPEVGVIEPPGIAEGGDIILAGEVAFVGRSSRTNDEGIAQLRAILAPMGYEIRVADVPIPSLHIGGMMSMVGPRAVLACEGAFPPGFFEGFEVISIPKESFVSGNVIALGDGRVIVEQRNFAARKLLDWAGYSVQSLNLSEFLKGSGGPTCLILPVARG